MLQRNFEIDSNPDGQDLERIALNAGLSKRVTQVWFQNARARQKKHTHLGKRKGNTHISVKLKINQLCAQNERTRILHTRILSKKNDFLFFSHQFSMQLHTN